MVTKIMPVGASNTYGMYEDPTSPGGYRGPLYDRLLAQGRDFDFVGLDSDGNIPDSDHNGYSGKPIDWFTGPVNEALYDANGSYNITINTGTQPAIQYFIEQAGLTSTDVILLLVGTNDVRLGDSAETMLKEIQLLLDLIVKSAASPLVQLMKLQPIGGDYWADNDPTRTNNDTIAIFNAGLEKLVTGTVTSLDPSHPALANLEPGKYATLGVALVDSGVTQTDLSSDGVHLNETGYRKVAQAWSDSLAAQQLDVLTGIVRSGDALANVLEGADRDDVLNGYGGNDTLRGLAGNDKLAGGDGDDLLEGGGGNDTLNGQAGHDRLFGADGDDLLSGGDGNDRLEGSVGSDDFRDGAGNDILLGGDGNDTLDLGVGDDTVDGGAGIDWLRVVGNATSTVDLAIATKAQRTGFGTDTIRNIENVSGGSGVDKLYGDGGVNVLQGNAGDDFLYGRAGGDTLQGGLGRDTMYAGAGDGASDVFVFATVKDSVIGRDRDVVYDFKPHASPNDTTADLIDLRQTDANLEAAGDQPFAFSGTIAEANSIWYAKGRSEVIVAGDVNGDKLADFEIRLAGVSALTVDDFMV